MLKWMVCLICLLFPVTALAWTAHIEFDPPADLTYRTVVLISETSGDYSEAFGQISDPGAVVVDIGNIKAETQYYAIAYRLNLANDKSDNCDELAFLTDANLPPVVIDLPPLVVGGQVLNIQITVD